MPSIVRFVSKNMFKLQEAVEILKPTTVSIVGLEISINDCKCKTQSNW